MSVNIFARWSSEEECLQEMLGLHDEESARVIVAGINQRVSSDTLFKSLEGEMRVISKAGDDELIVYGPCSWEKIDPENDLITAGAMSKFFKKWFSAVPERYRNVMLMHKSFQAGVPLLKYQGSDGQMYYTHVHEKGAMLISKIRDDDGLAQTKDLRQKVHDGVYKSYSIGGMPIDVEKEMQGDRLVSIIKDIDPGEVTICPVGMNDMAKFELVKVARTEAERAMSHFDISQGDWDELSDEKKQDYIDRLPERGTAGEKSKKLLEKPFAGYDDLDDCVSQNQDKDDPAAYCASIMHDVEGKAKEMTLDEINAKIAELRAILKTNQDKISEYYRKLPDTPEWVDELYDDNSALYDELSAWREARVERIVEDAKAPPKEEKEDVNKILEDAFQPFFKMVKKRLDGMVVTVPDSSLQPQDLKKIMKQAFDESIEALETKVREKIESSGDKPKSHEEVSKAMDERTLETALKVREIFKELENIG